MEGRGGRDRNRWNGDVKKSQASDVEAGQVFSPSSPFCLLGSLSLSLSFCLSMCLLVRALAYVLVCVCVRVCVCVCVCVCVRVPHPHSPMHTKQPVVGGTLSDSDEKPVSLQSRNRGVGPPVPFYSPPFPLVHEEPSKTQ